jgi:hypothetical protein
MTNFSRKCQDRKLNQKVNRPDDETKKVDGVQLCGENNEYGVV